MKKFIYTYPATSMLMLIFLLGSIFASLMFPAIFSFLDIHGDSLARGEWYRLISAGFINAGIVHASANIYGVYAVGIIIEKRLGSFHFFLYFLLGSVITYLIFPAFFEFSSSAGSSPGIYALIGAAFIYLLTNKNYFAEIKKRRFFYGLIIYFIAGNFITLTSGSLIVINPDRFFVHGIGFLAGILLQLCKSSKAFMIRK